MKPLLIIPPAPARWPALEELWRHKGQPWLNDIRTRVVTGVAGAQDAYVIIPAGRQALAGACINKQGDIGVLGHCYTRPEQRRRGYARRLVETLLSWFEMTGGKWLFLGTTAELDDSFYRKFGFAPLRRVTWSPYDRLTMIRRAAAADADPLTNVAGELVVRPLTRADWPAMVALLQYRPGPDPRVPLAESAVNAELFTLDLLDHLERGACKLLGAFRGPRLTAMCSLATDRPGNRTYALLVPHDAVPPELHTAALELGHQSGYELVEFPLQSLSPAPPHEGLHPPATASEAQPFAGDAAQP